MIVRHNAGSLHFVVVNDKLRMTRFSAISPLEQPAFCPVRYFTFLLLGMTLYLAVPMHVMADVTRTNEDKKKKDKIVVYTPEAKSLNVNFVAGVAVEIELTAAVGSLKQVEFVIRQAPENGTLTEPRPHPRDNNKALVIYTPRAAQSALQDSFTYACRLDGGSMSAPATVMLNGKKFDPQLEVQGAPRFDRVFLGGEATARVLVKNKGPAVYKSTLVFEEPWSGPPELEVAPGQTAELLINFRPSQAGNYRNQITLQAGLKESILYLYGECIQVLTISPGRLALNYSPSTGERSGILTIVNTRADPATVSLKLPARLQGQKTINLEPLAKAELLLKLLPDDVALFQDEVTVETGSMSESVLVVADAKPGQMRLLAPTKGEPVRFGEVKQKGKAHGEVTLSNVGGQAIIAGARSSVPFFIEEAGQALRLEPGQQRNLSVELNTDRTGKFSGTLEVTGGSETITVPLVGEVFDSATGPIGNAAPKAEAPPKASYSPQPSPVRTKPKPPTSDEPPNRSLVQSSVIAFLSAKGLPVPKRLVNQYLEPPGPLEVLDRTTTTATIAWPKPAVPPADWSLEIGRDTLDFGNAAFLKTWQPYSSWKLHEADPGKVAIKIENLNPATQYEFHVLARDREGKHSQASAVVMVETRIPWSVPPWLWRVLIIAALAIAIYVLQKIRKGEFEFEF